MKWFLFCAVLIGIAVAQPNPQQSEIGRQYPYVRTITVRATSVVTTVYSIKFLRVVEDNETNYVQLKGTNIHLIAETNMIRKLD